MTSVELTPRQYRERQFYEEYSRRTAPPEVSLDAILGSERRPWNAYWVVCELVMRHFQSRKQKLLDFGCGPGTYSLPFARGGYEVFGIDISRNNIAIATRLAAKYGLEERTHFAVGPVEKLFYPPEFFDLVVGIDILHHVDVRRAITECHRVLKPGGVALFKEWIEVPVFDRLRNTKLGKRLVPNTWSYERHVTADEKKLTADDLKAIGALYRDMSIRRFRLLARLEGFVSKRWKQAPAILSKIDARAFRLFPFLQRLGGEIVLTMRKG